MASLENTKNEQAIDQNDSVPETSETSIPNTPLRPRHRRNRPPVKREDIVKFRAEVLGIPPVEEPHEEEGLKELDLAFSSASMSLASGNGNTVNANTNPNTGAGLFTNFFDNNAAPTSSMTSMPRLSPSTGAGQNGETGGMVGMNVGMPMNAGHEMDLNHLYQMVIELSEVLKNSRDMTKGIINSAEEIMVCFLSPRISGLCSASAKLEQHPSPA